MNWLSAMTFTHTTLLLTFILPFAYYGYASSYWYLPNRIRLLNVALSVLCLLVIAVTLLKLKITFFSLDRSLLTLELLHLLPPALALCAMWLGKSEFASIGRPVERSNQEQNFAPRSVNAEVEKLSWDSLVISQAVKEELISVVELLKDPSTATKYGISVPKGILLSGPPGTGKTTIAKVIANTAGLSFFSLRADQVVSKWVGESEKNLSKLFESAKQAAPAVIFIDEVDSFGKKRSETGASHSDNLVNHLLQLIDGVVKVEGLYIIAATNRPELVDEALKRAGRLNRVIEIPLPDRAARHELFSLYLSSLRIVDDVDIDSLADVTEGNSAADIKEICNQAGMHAYRRESASGNSDREFSIRSEDLEAALDDFSHEEDSDAEDDDSEKAKPGPQNEQIEKIGWEDLVIDEDLKQELESVVALLKDPHTAQEYGIEIPKGILLNGPPGTGKTTIAKVIANTANLSFFVLKVDEIVSKWVGESEKNLTRLFKTAAKHAPAVIFIDEVDSIGKNRAEGNAQHSDNLLNHLLQLIDGVIKQEGIYIIAATNRADLVDPALKRGGRLNKTIEIPLPSFEGRFQLFTLYLSKLRLAQKVDVAGLAELTEGKSASDIKQICNQAGLNAFKRESARGNREFLVLGSDIEAALHEALTLKQ